MRFFGSYLLVLFVLVSCSKHSEDHESDMELDEVLSKKITVFHSLPVEATNPENPLTKEKIKLGQMLYYDTRLSKGNTQSCNTCHDLKAFGVDNLATSPGDLKQNGTRNSPTTLNSALHSSMFWDGRAKDVEEQAGMPILNPVEMNIPSKEFLVERLSKTKEYPSLFKEAFPESDTALTYLNIQQAIGAFERKLITRSAFDDYLAGDKKAISLQAKKGLNIFIENGCPTCHNGNVLGGHQLQKFGVHEYYWKLTGSEKVDLGRADVTGDVYDHYVFKVPSLRNITKTAPYFHDGSVKDLKGAVKVMAKLQINKEFNDEELEDIIAFLTTLEGKLAKEYQINPFDKNSK